MTSWGYSCLISCVCERAAITEHEALRQRTALCRFLARVCMLKYAYVYVYAPPMRVCARKMIPLTLHAQLQLIMKCARAMARCAIKSHARYRYSYSYNMRTILVRTPTLPEVLGTPYRPQPKHTRTLKHKPGDTMCVRTKLTPRLHYLRLAPPLLPFRPSPLWCLPPCPFRWL